MYQREALWINFKARDWKPDAIKVAVGKINAVSGKPWHQKLRTKEWELQQDDDSVDISDSKIVNYPVNKPKKIQDGNW